MTQRERREIGVGIYDTEREERDRGDTEREEREIGVGIYDRERGER